MRPTVRVFAATALILLGAARKPEPVVYKLSPVMQAGALAALQIELRFRADPSGVTRLDLPDAPDHGDAMANVRDLAISGAGSIARDGGARRVITSAPRAPIIVRYRVVSALDHEPGRSDGQPFLPWVRPRWFYITGASVFATPHGRDAAPVRFDWTGAPLGFAFASDLENLAGAHRSALHAGVVGDITNSVAMGGYDVRISTRGGKNAPLRVAVHGSLDTSDAAFFEQLQRILTSERVFWGDKPAPFLVPVAVTPGATGVTSVGGSGYRDAFSLAMTAGSSPPMLHELLAHEYFHSWNPAKLGGIEDGPRERLAYWFSEGFTDFYARRLMLRSGESDPAAFAASWNRALAAYAVSKVRSEPNTRILADFWKNPEVEKLPYQRGSLLAAVWDRKLRSAGSDGLDAVLRAQRQAATSSAATAPGGAPALFVQTARRLGLDVSPDVARFVDRGEPILLPWDVFGPCAIVQTQTRPKFERGWDAEATEKAADIVTGLDPASPAYAAGLRDGRKLVAREQGEPGDSTQPYALRVDDRGRQRVIRFLPVGKGEVTVQKVVLAQPPGIDCVKSLAGG